MKTSYWLAVGLVAFLYWRNHNGASGNGITRIEEANSANDTGSDFLPDMWSLLGGQGLSSPNFPNLVDGPNAHPGGQAAASLGLSPTWDGGLA
jgi:hypothetical protein